MSGDGGAGDAQAGADAARYASDSQARSAAQALEFAKQVYGSDKGWREKTYADQFQMLIEQQRRARQQYAQQIQYRHPFVYAGQSAATGLMQLLGLQNPAMPGVIQESQFGKGAVSGFPYKQTTSTTSTSGTGGGTGGTGGGPTPPNVPNDPCVDVGGGEGGLHDLCCAEHPDSPSCLSNPPPPDPCAGLSSQEARLACCQEQVANGNPIPASCPGGHPAPHPGPGRQPMFTSPFDAVSGGTPTTKTTTPMQTVTDPVDGTTKQVPSTLVSFYQANGWS